jgi:nitrogen-specific signal transduction histidine kinase
MPSSSAIERKLKREIAARKAAEALLEQKSLELFYANQQLEVALKQTEARSEASFKRLEFQQKIERILIHFGRIFLRANLDDVLVVDLVNQLSEVTDDVACAIALPSELLPAVTQSHYQTPKYTQLIATERCTTSCISIELEQKVIGRLELGVLETTFDMDFVNSQMSLVCELLASSINRQVINQRLVESKDRAEASERSTREFLAMINHELRTPLNGLLGSVELLADTGLSDAQKDLHHNLSQSGQLLRSIINDLLDFSKIDAGMLELIESKFTWSTLESTLKSIFEHKAQEKQIGFKIETQNLDSQQIKGDLERITQIFVNLIGNAIKFTDKGDISVRVENSASGLQVSVTDTGIGIS